MSERESFIDAEGMAYLDEIFRGKWHIANPTPLEIKGLGKITATSTLWLGRKNYETGEFESYFNFKQNGRKGKIIKHQESGKYFIEYKNTLEASR